MEKFKSIFFCVIVLSGFNSGYSMESGYDQSKNEYTSKEVENFLERAKQARKEMEDMISHELTVLQEEETPHEA